MSVPTPYTEKSILADIRRFIRLFPREKLDVPLVEYIRKNFVPRLSPKKEVMLMVDKDMVIDIVCEYFGLTVEQMGLRTKRRSLTYQRQILEFMLSTKTPMTLVDVGKLFGRHYTTVLASKNKIIDGYNKSPTIRRDVDKIMNMLPEEAKIEQYGNEEIIEEDLQEKTAENDPAADQTNGGPNGPGSGSDDQGLENL